MSTGKITEGASGTRAPSRVLLVDDDDALRTVSARVLSSAGFQVVEASDGRDALAEFQRRRFDVVVTDVRMPKTSGLELLRSIRDRDLDVPVVLLTGKPDMEAAREARRYGALNYLTKPVDNQRLVMTVTRALRIGWLTLAKRSSMDELGSQHPRAGDLAGIELSLERALASMWLVYQPIVRAADRALFAYEALMRSREIALPNPTAILGAAERAGRLPRVGRRVRELAASLIPPEPALLFVNIHASDLEDPSLVDPRAPLASLARRVVLEITDRASLEGFVGVERQVAELREVGFRIAIDDLGAGYAGLTSFVLLEPDFLKLDATLVRGVDATSSKAKVIRALCDLGRDLGIRVVAEGIETVAERDCLVDLGCELLQGYLLARPGENFPSFTWAGPDE